MFACHAFSAEKALDAKVSGMLMERTGVKDTMSKTKANTFNTKWQTKFGNGGSITNN